MCCRGFLALSLCACSGSAQDVAHAINQARVHVSGHFDEHGGGDGCAINNYNQNGAINNNILQVLLDLNGHTKGGRFVYLRLFRIFLNVFSNVITHLHHVHYRPYHSCPLRLEVMAMSPAPLQFLFHGYAGARPCQSSITMCNTLQALPAQTSCK